MKKELKQRILKALYSIEPKTDEVSHIIIDLEMTMNEADIPNMTITMDDVKSLGYKCKESDLENIAEKMHSAIQCNFNEMLNDILFYDDYEQIN